MVVAVVHLWGSTRGKEQSKSNRVGGSLGTVHQSRAQIPRAAYEPHPATPQNVQKLGRTACQRKQGEVKRPQGTRAPRNH